MSSVAMSGRGWHPIEPLDRTVEKALGHNLATLDAVHRSWQEHRTEFGRIESTYPFHQTLRKHAIETGIIEGLYDLDRPTTDVMVIKGITRGADTADAEVPPGVLRMLRAHKEGLEMVFELARAGRPLTCSFIRELHALITRAQPFCFLTDPTRRYAQVMMDHGSFKRFPNRVRRADGTVLDFAPPEQVEAEIRRLIDLYEAMTDVHPVVVAAWLHHRFAQIHPFQDGNGRVARALAALPLERAQYPPIVVDRNRRDAYLLALDEANDGDLVPLARLFTELALRSIRRELDESTLDSFAGMAMEEEWLLAEVVDPEELDLIDRAIETGANAGMRADRLHDHIWDWLRPACVDIDQEFAEAGTGSPCVDGPANALRPSGEVVAPRHHQDGKGSRALRLLQTPSVVVDAGDVGERSGPPVRDFDPPCGQPLHRGDGHYVVRENPDPRPGILGTRRHLRRDLMGTLHVLPSREYR